MFIYLLVFFSEKQPTKFSLDYDEILNLHNGMITPIIRICYFYQRM